MKSGLIVKGIKEARASILKMDAGKAVKMQAMLDKIGFHLLGKAMMSSPVDTGRFRANWRTGRPPKMAGSVAEVYIANTLPYSGVLEYGSPVGGKPWASPGAKTVVSAGRIFSKQAPDGVLEKHITPRLLDSIGADLLRGVSSLG